MPHPQIASLDRQLARKGESVALQRTLPDGTTIEAGAQGFCRGYRPDELVGGIEQGDSGIVLSPTDLQTAGWPAPPKTGDRVIVQGRTRIIVACAPVAIGETIVRYDLQVRG